MLIKFMCPACGKHLKTRSATEGKANKCPFCGTAVHVSIEPAPAQPSENMAQANVLSLPRGASRALADDEPDATITVDWMAGSKLQDLQPWVFIDGEKAGKVEQTIPISTGRHKIQIREGWVWTRERAIEIGTGVHGRLEYSGKGFTLVALLALPACLSAAMVRNLVDQGTDPVSTLLALSGIGLVMYCLVRACFWVASRWYAQLIPCYLQLHQPQPTGLDQEAGVLSSVPQIAKGRILVHLEAKGAQPRLRVIIDGRNVGTVSDTFPVRAGRHRVRLKGWFDRSKDVVVFVGPNEQIKLEAELSQAGTVIVVVLAVAAALCFLLLMAGLGAEWNANRLGVDLLVPFIGIFCAAFVLSRFLPTLQLSGSFPIATTTADAAPEAMHQPWDRDLSCDVETRRPSLPVCMTISTILVALMVGMATERPNDTERVFFEVALKHSVADFKNLQIANAADCSGKLGNAVSSVFHYSTKSRTLVYEDKNGTHWCDAFIQSGRVIRSDQRYVDLQFFGSSRKVSSVVGRNGDYRQQ